MSERLKLTGKRFGRLIVLKCTGANKYQHTTWLCKCDCENEKVIVAESLVTGATKSCGCLHKERTGLNKVNLSGKIFGKLRVIEEAGRTNGKQVKWLCKCKCGRKHILAGYRLTQGVDCCPSCELKRRAKALSGKNNCNWKGGITPAKEKIRRSAKYAKWRKTIFDRDNYTCQNCGKNKCNLEVHHIYPFAIYPKIRWEKLNAITLCLDCHGKTKGKEFTYREKFSAIIGGENVHFSERVQIS